jgi:beta-galactosidase
VLVGHWKLDNNAQDSSGNGNNGTLSGGPTYVAAGRIGAALSLDGTDDYVDCGNGASLNITDTITLSAWINPADVGNAEHNPYVAKGDTSYSLKHHTSNYIQFVLYRGGTWYTANGPVLTSDVNGSWHHVAGTYDGTQMKFYMDGQLVASRLVTLTFDQVTYNVQIGHDSQNTDRYYRGDIDDVRIYHGALPKSEVVKLANP